MGYITPDLSLVVPVHHCGGPLERSLAALETFVRQSPMMTELIIVDDRGSDPRGTRMLRDFAHRPFVRLLENDRNRGKGYSVRRGMLAARGHFRVFTDADLAYPLSQVWHILRALDLGADVAIACRVLRKSSYEVEARSAPLFHARRVMSRAFNGLVRAALLPGIFDTQAGLKGYTAAAANAIFSRIRISGFGFDLESLYLARHLGLEVLQVPVRYRFHESPSTVRILRDGGRMAVDVARIRWRAMSGVYDGMAKRVRPGRMPRQREVRIFQA